VSDQALHSELVQLTCDLIAIPSTADQPAQLQAVIDYAERYAQAIPGVRIQRFEWAGKPSLVLGLRPEHIAETRPHAEPNQHDFEQVIEVVEPMGMETLVYFTIGGAEICGRVNPNAGATAEQPMKLRADLSNMHLIDDVTGKVL